MVLGIVRSIGLADTKALAQVIRKKLFTAAQSGTLEKATESLSRKYPNYRGFIKSQCAEFNEVGLDLSKMNAAAKIFQENHRAERALYSAHSKGKRFTATV